MSERATMMNWLISTKKIRDDWYRWTLYEQPGLHFRSVREGTRQDLSDWYERFKARHPHDAIGTEAIK